MEENNAEIQHQTSLSEIILKISVSDRFDFDEREEEIFLQTCIDKCYSQEFKMIESKELIRDINKLNIEFVNLIHYCNNNYKYKNVSKMFISFCDYFDIEYNKTYISLHQKIQELIKSGFINMIGGISAYTKLKNKIDPTQVKTLFDLLR